MPQGTCSTCQKPMNVNAKSAPPDRRRCHPCRRADGGRPCIDCGKPKGKHGSRCYTCDRADRGRKAGIEWQTGIVCLVHFRDCDHCGRHFTARHTRTKLCSRACQIAVNCERTSDLYATALALGPVRGRMWYDILVGHLRERDGDDCGLCGRAIDFNVASGVLGSDSGRSVDHIQPRSLGGSDELDNLRLTHWGCNRRRGNRAESETAFPVLYSGKWHFDFAFPVFYGKRN